MSIKWQFFSIDVSLKDIQNSFLNAISPRFGGLGGLGGSPFGNCPKEVKSDIKMF